RPASPQRQARASSLARPCLALRARGDCLLLIRLDAVEELLTAQKQLLADRGGRGVEGVIQPVRRQHLQLVALLQLEGGACLGGEVDAARRRDRGGVETLRPRQALPIEDRLARPGVENG